jgi:hypothetical protein
MDSPAKTETPTKPPTDILFARNMANAMVSGFLCGSSRIDTFSTWLMGITAAAIVIVFTHLDSTLKIIGTAWLKTIMAMLAISSLIGVIQKCYAVWLQMQIDIQNAMEQKIRESVSSHAGQQMPDSYKYFREHADVDAMTVILISAFPKWVQEIFRKSLTSKTPPLLENRQKDTRFFFYQLIAVFFQLLTALGTVAMVGFSL